MAFPVSGASRQRSTEMFGELTWPVSRRVSQKATFSWEKPPSPFAPSCFKLCHEIQPISVNNNHSEKKRVRQFTSHPSSKCFCWCQPGFHPPMKSLVDSLQLETSIWHMALYPSSLRREVPGLKCPTPNAPAAASLLQNSCVSKGRWQISLDPSPNYWLKLQWKSMKNVSIFINIICFSSQVKMIS